MKTATVPAQVTSKEDTIAGNLTLTQIILLVVPLFGSAFIFAVVPPSMHINLYKFLLAFGFSLPVLLLAVRINGQLVLRWLMLVVAYRFRPRLYLWSQKPSRSCSCIDHDLDEPVDAEPIKEILDLKTCDELEPVELMAIDLALNNRAVEYLANKEGKLNAFIKSS